MKIAIIEDEKLTAEDLAETILKIEPDAQVVSILSSVRESILYFSKNEQPDLIFSDIQLGDGLSFEIFKAVTVSTPVIFCTAFDEYALNAFKANGIDYILKPFSENSIAGALAKYKGFKNNFFNSTTGYQVISEEIENRRSQLDTSVLIYIKDKILPIKFNDIAFFYIENEMTYLVTFEQKRYSIGKTLEELEKISGSSFYRANRQYLVNHKAVKAASHYFHRKLIVNLCIPSNEPIIISKVKASEFLNWLSGK